MKNFKLYGYFFLLLPAFVSVCILFVFIGNSFCKEAPVYVATAPQKNQTLTLIIDAGHGGEDGGAVGVNGALEKDLNLEIAFLLRDMALAAGYDTVMTRTEDILLYDKNVDYKGRKKALDLLARVKIAEQYENAVFVSIHMNAFPQEQYSGLQVYYSENDPLSQQIAKDIQDGVRTSLQNKNNRKIKPAGANIYLLDRIRLPSVLIECGFLSNTEECEKLSTEEYRQKLALSIFLSISEHLRAKS